MKLVDYVSDRAQSSLYFRRAQRNARSRSKLLADLRAARRRSGMTQAAVAGLMETTQSAVSEVESRSSDPRVSTLQRYASAIDHEIRFKVVPALEVATPVDAEMHMAETPTRVIACEPAGKIFDNEALSLSSEPLSLAANG